MLKNYGFYTAKSGCEAKEYYLNHNCHLVLFDATAFENRSFKILKSIREISEISVMLFKENQNGKDMLKAFDNGADDYIVKPFIPRALIR